MPAPSLYGEFADSWRINADTSLFVYGSGETAEDYAGGAVPGPEALSGVSADATAAAEAACASVAEPALYRGCITDASCSGAEADTAAAWFVSDPAPTLILDVSPPEAPAECFIPGVDALALPDASVNCPAGCAGEGSVWGTDIYTDDSAVCAAAVHAGLIDDAVGGSVVVTSLPGRAAYVGSTRNGVTTSDWGEWPASFSLSL